MGLSPREGTMEQVLVGGLLWLCGLTGKARLAV